MKITPELIETKEFKKNFLGYNKKDVDFFLDKIIDEFENLLKDKQKLREEKDILLNQLSHFKKIENELNETLLKAKESADEIISKAELDYENKLQELSFKNNKNNISDENQIIVLQNKYNELKLKYFECTETIKILLDKNLKFLEENNLD